MARGTNGATAVRNPIDQVMEKVTVLTITPPRIHTLKVRITGTAPYMQCRFSEKAMEAMTAKQVAGSTARKGGARAARDFDADFAGALHVAQEGWIGIPAASIRNACISACRLVGFKMTLAKLSVFVAHDGLDAVDGTPLIRLIAGEPERNKMAVRNATGVLDLRVRPMWREWAADLRLQYDADQFTPTDVLNLLSRAGMQVGLGEGRPDSRMSAGMGFGLFQVEEA